MSVAVEGEVDSLRAENDLMEQRLRALSASISGMAQARPLLRPTAPTFLQEKRESHF